MKTTILVFCCLLLFIPCQAMGGQDEQNQQRLAEIDKYIAQKRIDIEDYYNGQLIEMNQRAEEEIKLLEVTDQAIYASLAEQAEVAKWVLHIDDFGYQAPWYLVDETERMLRLKDDFDKRKIKESPRWFTMALSSSESETTEITNGNSTSGSTSGSTFALAQSWIDDGGFEDIIKNSSKRFAVTQGLIAERKSRILAQLRGDILRLERQKQYALTTGLAQLEKKLKDNVLQPKPEATHGMVTGIIYSSDRPAAVIDRKILHEGDTIDGVKVVKIYRDRVVFGKKGRGWDQRVGEKPGASW
jgi:hypothetical protein